MTRADFYAIHDSDIIQTKREKIRLQSKTAKVISGGVQNSDHTPYAGQSIHNTCTVRINSPITISSGSNLKISRCTVRPSAGT